MSTVTIHLHCGCPDLAAPSSFDDEMVVVPLADGLDEPFGTDLHKVVPCSAMLARPSRLAAWMFARDTLGEVNRLASGHGVRLADPEGSFRSLESAYRRAQDVDALLSGCHA